MVSLKRLDVILYNVNILFKFFTENSKIISHNVPAVYDVLPARIRALRSKDQGWKNVGAVSRGSEAAGRPT
jgi:hypothetical protein